MEEINLICSGWTFQTPTHNFFKEFIKLNDSLKIKAIVFPTKKFEFIEDIPVIAKSDLLKIVGDNTVLLQTSINEDIKIEMEDFFSHHSLRCIEVNDFLRSVVLNDTLNQLKLPFGELNSLAIKSFLANETNGRLVNNLLDLESILLYKNLQEIFQSFSWDKFYLFDKDNSVDSATVDLLVKSSKILEPNKTQRFKKYYIVNEFNFFLENLIRFKLETQIDFEIYLNSNCMNYNIPRLAFYKLIFGKSLIFDTGFSRLDENTVIMGSNSEDFTAALSRVKMPSFILKAKKSIIEFDFLPLNILSELKFLLVQPNTNPSSLLVLALSL
jgi:hypothetical protein